MDALEPANIDWKNVDWRFVRDDTYEHINAPKWLDLSAPDDNLSPTAADKWFCRPDCRHPKTADDFLLLNSPSPKLKSTRSSPGIMPLGERKSNNPRDAKNQNSLKRRGAVASLLLGSVSPARDAAKSHKPSVKKFRENLENQDPNLSATNETSISINKPVKAAKEAMKSSAEKRGVENRGEERDVEEVRSKKPAPGLKSTLSARNLFSGRDILGQLSEFCNEIKKLAVGQERSSAAQQGLAKQKEEERVALVDEKSKGDDTPLKAVTEGKSRGKGKPPMGLKEVGDTLPMVLKEVRATPPTPQKIPSPSSLRLRSTAKAGISKNSSPLNSKPPKSAATPGREEKRALVERDDDEADMDSSSSAAAADVVAAEGEGSSMDMFWFFKPCTYLVK